MNFNLELNGILSEFEQYLKGIFKAGRPEIIYNAMAYSLFSGGKRLRPVLMLASCKSVCGEIAPALPFAAAMEMIHTYSLIHDDLPAMDNDNFRRGRPANHREYGEAIAILAGDGLLNMAFEVMAENITSKESLLAMRRIAKCAGACGMIGGQAADVLNENKTLGEMDLNFINKGKTAALISASLYAGAVLGGIDEASAEDFFEAGSHLGIAFQIEDDILDETSDLKTLGKEAHQDEKNGKNTYCRLWGLEKSKEEVLRLTNLATEIFLRHKNTEFLVSLSQYMATRSK